MPRYHFNVSNGVSSVDKQGIDLPDIQAARSEALSIVETIVAEAAQRPNYGDKWRMEVTDHAGQPLFRFDFKIQ